MHARQGEHEILLLHAAPGCAPFCLLAAEHQAATRGSRHQVVQASKSYVDVISLQQAWKDQDMVMQAA